MAYRNGTYVAFDGNGSTNPTKGDLRFFSLLRSWNHSTKTDFTFSDSHKKTFKVRDTSSIKTLQARLLQRMRNSKNMLLIISEDTNWDRGMLNYEIEKAVDYYQIPLIVAYSGYNYILDTNSLSQKLPKALHERIINETARCIHIPFKQKCIMHSINRFSVNNKHDQLTTPLHYYTKELYREWGYLI